MKNKVLTFLLYIFSFLLFLYLIFFVVVKILNFLSFSAPSPFIDFNTFLIMSGATIALCSFHFNLSRSRSEDILRSSIDLIEKSYEELAPKDCTELPCKSRLAWLTAARLLMAAEDLGQEITEPSHKLVYRKIKEYWRHRFYVLIFPNFPEGLPSTFYGENPADVIIHSERKGEPLSEKSLVFLYRFIKWPEEMPDPLAKVKDFTDEEIAKMELTGPRSLFRHLSAIRELKNAIKK
jgi:hypothetical protein